MSMSVFGELSYCHLEEMNGFTIGEIQTKYSIKKTVVKSQEKSLLFPVKRMAIDRWRPHTKQEDEDANGENDEMGQHLHTQQIYI